MSFSKRLNICRRKGKMTKGDLQRWFDRPYSTVETWVDDCREPRGPAGEEARKRLSLLERAIANNDGFPIPVEFSDLKRSAHTKKLYHDISTGVPRKNNSRKRV